MLICAKSGGVARWLPEMGYLYTVLGIFFQAQPWMTLFAGAGALVLTDVEEDATYMGLPAKKVGGNVD